MCEFVSFVVLPDGTIRVGDLESHSGIEKSWGLKPNSYREANWTKDDDGESLTIRVSPEDIQEGRNGAWWKSLILAKYSIRKSLLSSVTIGKSNRGIFHFKNGEFHREDGPAIERWNGDKEWWLNGKCHRENGPAIERGNGDKEWWLNGKRHRENGPAVQLCDNSITIWYLEGKLHRENGPAIDSSWGRKVWFLRGKCLTEQKFLAETKKQQEKNNI